jgi:hypothetical protein
MLRRFSAEPVKVKIYTGEKAGSNFACVSYRLLYNLPYNLGEKSKCLSESSDFRA